MIFGRILGKIIRVLAKKNLSIVSRNISTCFPTISNRDKKKLINKHFESIGISFFEISTAWFASLKKVKKIVKVNGIENLNNALSKGNGVILFTAHFTCLEIAGAILEEICPNSNCMYNPQKNKMVDMMIKSGRTRFAKDQIPKNSIRSMLKALKNNEVVVYLADHVYKGSNSELIPFFGEPALTNTATTKIAKISKAKILPYFIRRSDDDDYIVDIYPELENFPSEDHIKDTSRLVNQLEQHIRISPDQYVWNYKRFRGRPKKFVDIYKN
jgi:KDO2-lipid IV(A) lauroyltransferase|tara:strand:+ start:16854 stop:17666 length:813 start_codon:yes stop_codon:yes gene_type:complete